jgi:1-acyl-sn-glycerol-3-phosphate acyltransferase
VASRLETLLRILLHPVVALLSRVLFELRVSGSSRVPRGGPTILVANHEGYLDPFLLQMATTRPIRYMMTSDFYDIPWLRPFFRVVKAIRVPEGGPYRAALKDALGVLRAGGVVGIFPEGQLTLDGEIGEAMPGAAFLAARTGALVVPARIEGTIDIISKVRRFPGRARVTIRFGAPLRLDDPRAGDRILEAVKAI